MIISLFAEQHEIGNPLALEKAGDEVWPVLVCSPVIHRIGTAPEQRIAGAEIDPGRAQPCFAQTGGNIPEKGAGHALEENDVAACLRHAVISLYQPIERRIASS
ncbi:MAG TPA: hypothetical protein PLX84_04630 [Acidiphilium sp.]|nr:hypothetical protein [Acidiphilium sp.]